MSVSTPVRRLSVADILAMPAVADPVIGTPGTTPTNDEAPAKPPMYAIVLHNDETTFPTFVVRVLAEAFSVGVTDAWRIMDEAHRSGTHSVVKVVSKDIAETQLAAAQAMIAQADRSCYYQRDNRPCDLRFTIELECRGSEG